ncbi:MAG: hypothetical protein KDD99_16035 [Bacteroidetes bacterium]|nr:hypothetical protein [Bacteroidota bacterium]
MKSLITASLLLIFSIISLYAQPETDWTDNWKLKNKYLTALEKGEESQDAIVENFLKEYLALRDQAQRSVEKDPSGKISEKTKKELMNNGFSVVSPNTSGKDLVIENSSFIKAHTLGKLDKNIQQFIDLYCLDLDQPSRENHDPKGKLISAYEIKKRLTDWHDLSKLMGGSRLEDMIKEKKNYYLELDLELGVKEMAQNEKSEVKKAEVKPEPQPQLASSQANSSARLAPVSQLIAALNTLNSDALAEKQPIKKAEEQIQASARETIVISKDNIDEALEKAHGHTTMIVVSNATTPHTIILITDHDKKLASGSWGTKMPWGKGFTQKGGEVVTKEEYINNIIGGGSSSWIRTMYILE